MELAQTAQAVQQAGGLALLTTALTLGLRHGIDWDHIAAITDITGTTVAADTGGDGPAGAAAAVIRAPRAAPAGVLAPTPLGWRSFRRAQVRALWLASLYALGHASVVVALGLAALAFAAILPEWIDPLMERVVGVTLLALGAWVAYSLVRYWRGEGDFRLRSRWMLVFDGVRRGWWAFQARLHGHGHDGTFHVHRADQYGPRTAFGVGLIHGIGAETGTQVLLIAAVGGAASQGLGVGMLLAFVVGLLLSNGAVAFLSSLGFVSSSRAKALYVAAGVLTAAFSLWIGTAFVLGAGAQLPDPQELLNAIFGEAAA